MSVRSKLVNFEKKMKTQEKKMNKLRQRKKI